VMYLKEHKFTKEFELSLNEKAVVFLTFVGTLFIGIYPTPLFDAIKNIFGM